MLNCINNIFWLKSLNAYFKIIYAKRGIFMYIVNKYLILYEIKQKDIHFQPDKYYIFNLATGVMLKSENCFFKYL